jgi:alkylation response protein AidB-like acyl-CoA dehydrogenase
MDLTYSPAQDALRADARDHLGAPDAGEVTALARTAPGYDAVRWRALLERGWPTLSFATEHGGAGGSLSDLAVFAEELGRSAMPAPFHNGIVQAGNLLMALGGNAATMHLRALLAATARYALCLTEPEGSYRLDRISCTARRDGERWTITGTKAFVPYLDSADVLLVIARAEGDEPGALSVFAVDASAPGVERTTVDTIAGDRQGRLELATTVGPEALLGDLGAASPALRLALARAVIVQCADSVGAANAALDAAVARVTERVLFGQPVGSYQAIQHRGADMLTDLTLSRDAVMDAAAIADRGEDLFYAASVAKAQCAESCRRISAGALHIFGGEGVFADRPLHLWFRRIKGAEPALGDPRHHREVIADAIFGTAHVAPRRITNI